MEDRTCIYWKGYCSKGIINTPCDRIGCSAYYPRSTDNLANIAMEYAANPPRKQRLWLDELKGSSNG